MVFYPLLFEVIKELDKKRSLSTKGVYGYVKREQWKKKLLLFDVLGARADRDADLLKHGDYYDPFLRRLHMADEDLLQGGC